MTQVGQSRYGNSPHRKIKDIQKARRVSTCRGNSVGSWTELRKSIIKRVEVRDRQIPGTGRFQRTSSPASARRTIISLYCICQGFCYVVTSLSSSPVFIFRWPPLSGKSRLGSRGENPASQSVCSTTTRCNGDAKPLAATGR